MEHKNLNGFVRTLFGIGIVTIPFSGITGISGFGEMAHELSTYVFLLAIGLFGFASLTRANANRGRVLPRFYILPKMALFFFGVIFLSFLVNFFDISGAVYRGRWGFEKFTSSLITVVYCFVLAALSYALAEERWKSLLAKPIAISLFLCTIFAILEVAARWLGIGNGFYLAISGLVHGGYGEMEFDPRIRSLAFEPPWLGNYLGFAFPWILAAWYTSRKSEHSFYGAALFSLFCLLGVSMARTGLVMIGGGLVVFLLLRRVYLSQSLRGQAHKIVTSFLIGFLVLALLLVGLTEFGGMVGRVIASDSTTNISRLASILAGFAMFGDHPIFGVGFGQYGFHLEHYLPYWAYYSSEFALGPNDPQGLWPASYSAYARFASEMGVFGLALWVGVWSFMSRKTLAASVALARATGSVPAIAFPLIMSFIAVLLSGISTESLRSPMIWISLGVGCRYLAIASSARVELIKPAASTSSLEE